MSVIYNEAVCRLINGKDYLSLEVGDKVVLDGEGRVNARNVSLLNVEGVVAEISKDDMLSYTEGETICSYAKVELLTGDFADLWPGHLAGGFVTINKV